MKMFYDNQTVAYLFKEVEIPGEIEEHHNLYYNFYDNDDYSVEYDDYEDFKGMKFFRVKEVVIHKPP